MKVPKKHHRITNSFTKKIFFIVVFFMVVIGLSLAGLSLFAVSESGSVQASPSKSETSKGSNSSVGSNSEKGTQDLEKYVQDFSAFLQTSQCLDQSTKDDILRRLQALQTASGSESEEDGNYCEAIIEKCFDGHFAQTSLITEHFKNDAPTSELIRQALDLIRAFDNESFTLMNYLLFQTAANRTIENVADFTDDCNTTRTQLYDDILIPSLRDYALKNSVSKRSYTLVQKYKSINAQLAALNDDMAKWQGYIEAFTQKLPALSKYCQ